MGMAVDPKNPTQPILRQTRQALDALRQFVWFNLLSADKQYKIAKIVGDIANGQSQSHIDEINKLRLTLDALVNAASEQQFTLGEQGWHNPDDLSTSWSKAGARRHQYDRVTAVIEAAKVRLEQ